MGNNGERASKEKERKEGKERDVIYTCLEYTGALSLIIIVSYSR